MSEPPDRLLTTREAAALCAVSDRTIRTWASTGKLAARRLPGGARRFRRDDVVALLRPERVT